MSSSSVTIIPLHSSFLPDLSPPISSPKSSAASASSPIPDSKRLTECTDGCLADYWGAEDCRVWSCHCPLQGKCLVPAKYKDKICERPCKKHFPDPIKCMGGRGRILPNGCIIWQCNCPTSLCGPCIKPATVLTENGSEPICKHPCTVHPPSLSS